MSFNLIILILVISAIGTQSTYTNKWPCGIWECDVCDPVSNKCLLCTPGNGLQSDGLACGCNVEVCQECDPLDINHCKSCDGGLGVDREYQCYCDVWWCNGCATYSSDICTGCWANYTLSQDNTTCYPSNTIYNETECNIAGCQACNKTAGWCLACEPNIGTNKNYLACGCGVEDCLACDSHNMDHCQTCKDGLGLTPSYECKCELENCLSCHPYSSKVCTQCADGYAISSNNATCIAIENSIIYPCSITGCNTCNAITQTCIECLPGLSVSDNGTACQCNVDNCALCESSNPNTCNTCQNGYLLSEDSQSCTGTTAIKIEE